MMITAAAGTATMKVPASFSACMMRNQPFAAAILRALQIVYSPTRLGEKEPVQSCIYFCAFGAVWLLLESKVPASKSKTKTNIKARILGVWAVQ